MEGVNTLKADSLRSNDRHPTGIGDILRQSIVPRWLSSDISIEQCSPASIQPHHSPQQLKYDSSYKTFPWSCSSPSHHYQHITICQHYTNTSFSSIKRHHGSHSAIRRHPSPSSWLRYVNEGYNPILQSRIRLRPSLSPAGQAVRNLKPDPEPT